MKVYCLRHFKNEYEKLKRRSSYRVITNLITDYFFDEEAEPSKYLGGRRLNGHSQNPYIKQRIGGAGGFRVYYYFFREGDNIYLMYLHPKSGSRGASNVTTETQAMLYKTVLEAINGKDELFIVEWSGQKSDDITFTLVSDLLQKKA